MKMVLQMSSESGCLRVKATGKFSLAEAERTFLKMLGSVERQKVDKVLFDGRGLKGNPETIERLRHARPPGMQSAAGVLSRSLLTCFKSQSLTPIGSAKSSPQTEACVSEPLTISTTLADGSA
jgi:hypothetical protein